MTTLLYAGRYSDQIVDDYGEPIDGGEVYGDVELDYPEGDVEASDELISWNVACHGHWARADG